MVKASAFQTTLTEDLTFVDSNNLCQQKKNRIIGLFDDINVCGISDQKIVIVVKYVT